MTPVNSNELSKTVSGFPPQASYLLLNPKTRPIFTSIIIILKVYPVLLLVLGSLGNLLSFCVLLRANMRRYSTFCYLACLALVDLGVIITFCINFISLYHFNNDIQDEPFACNLFAFCIYFLPQYSSWILVAVSIDRVISAKYLRLAKTWSKPKHSVLVTLILGLFLGILNSHFFLYDNNPIKQRDLERMMQNNQSTPERFLSTDTLVNRHSNALESLNNISSEGTISTTSISYESFTSSSIYRDTTAQQQYDSYNTMSKEVMSSFDVNRIHCSLESSPEHASLHLYWVWIDLLMNVFLPFTAMIACTIIIILTLVRSSTRSGSTSVRRSRRRRNISVMLITINLVFISLTAPIVIFLSMYPHLKEEQNNYRRVVLILIKIFCIILMNLNHSVNIIIYSVTAKEFRSETKNFLHALLYCCIGKPTSPIEFAHSHHDGTFISRLTRLRINLFKCCRVKINSNSTNTTDSSGLPHTATAGTNKISSKNEYRHENKFNKRKQLDKNGKKTYSVICYSETTALQKSNQYLTVQLQPDPSTSTFEREDLSLHGLSNLTEH
ncbi:unnamed protein product [Rotaria magnacalcarata]|uniref:G-protein coupled receptors family 1 profile domain-containing protein n=2 Tax=Rotaria magnacalcarata TaxID=392030 RepID=A0A819M035_9BILA|nr:unnamed protein product [Rotaria magnacalcarata]CAF2220492.1 unnamed protein product [Rotaria magnacalcarata]CAF3859385.1 unnamed protein product [Rotaria magnacalcarata]CAF3971529.1 unnamed protein product [Rotaria magnacalcarata]